MKRTHPALLPVVTKARQYLRASTATLTAVLVLCVSVTLALQYQADVRRDNFDGNSNLHVISVSHRLEGSELRTLAPSDVGEIRELVQSSEVGRGGTTVSPRLALGAGLVSGQGEPLVIVGIDPQVAAVVGLDDMVDGTAYSTNPQGGPVEVSVPVVAMDGPDGMTSSEMVEMSLQPGPALDRTKVQYLEGGSADSTTYVTSETYWSIAEAMFGRDRSEVVSDYLSGELSMVPLVDEVYVLVPELQDVREVAALIDQQGYGASYALQAFDEIESGLATQRVLGTALGLLLVIGVAVYFILSWRSYLTLSRRDIGTLRHWSVPERDIARLYGGCLVRSLVIPLVGTTAVACGGSFVLFGGGEGAVRAVACTGALLLVLIVLGSAVARFVIGPTVRRDVLDLLRRNREFQ